MSSDDHSATSARDDSREGWQGRRATVSYTAPQYRWQGGGGSNVAQQVSRPRRRQHWWILFWLLALWGLYGVYVWLLAHSPRRVPLLTAVATKYDLPLPPNAWAQEDLDQLEKLDGENLRLIKTSDAWKSRSAGLAEWKQRILDLARQGSPSGVALFYVSMHGAVDEQGRSCLIPPGVAPLDSQQWIPVEELLHPLKLLPDHWRKIVFLDASRQPNNWQLGILENTFPDRLPDAVQRAKVPGLHVMNSAGPEQINWSSPDLAGSVFGREVALGLAGAADFKSTDPLGIRTAGNTDGQVSLQELLTYVQRRARLWARRNRAAIQVPQLLPEDTADFVICRSMHASHARELRSNKNSQPRAKDAVPSDKIAELWRQVDALRELQPQRGEPIAWRDLEQRLLWLEQLATAGRAYDDDAQSVFRQLSTQLKEALERAEGIEGRPALAARVSVLDPRAADWPRQLPLHSLPLCEYFGVVNLKDAAKLRQQLDELAGAVDLQQFEARLRAALQSAPRAEVLGGLVETHVLRLGQQYRVPSPALWNGPIALQRMLELRQRADQLMTGDDERAHYWTRHEWREADELRRQAEDRVFAGPDVAGPEPWQPALASFDRALRSNEGLSAHFRSALDTRDRALAVLPHLARLYASNEPLGKPVAGTTLDLVPSDVESAINATLRLGRKLEAIPTGSLPETEANEIIDLAQNLAQQIDALRKDHEKHCQQLLAEKKSDSPTLRGLELALQVPLVGAKLRQEIRQEAQSLATSLHETATQRAAKANREAQKSSPSQATALPKAPPASDPTPLEGSRDRLNNWPVHPLLAILQLDTAKQGLSSQASATSATKSASAKPAADAAKSDAAKSDAAKSDSGETKAVVEDEPRPSTVTVDQLARWELNAARVRQRLDELSRWTATGASADAALETGASKKMDGNAVAELSAASAPSAATSTAASSIEPANDPVASAELVDDSTLANSVREFRLELSKAEYQLRAAAALGALAPKRNPVSLLRHFDLQQLLILHARRSLDDFWGSGRRGRNDAPTDPPFFAKAVRDHLEAAELIAPPSMVVRRQIDSVRVLLRKRLAAAAGAVALHVDTSESSGSTDLVRFRVHAMLAGGTSSASSAGAAVHLPTGEATVFVRQGKDILDGKRITLPIPPGENPPEKTIEAIPSDASGVGLEAAMLFRGHEFSRPFFRRGLGGVLVRYEPTMHESAQVTLFGQRRQQSSVMFILDCSSSMSRNIFAEAIGQDLEQQPRLDVAKSVLQEFLEQIAERGDMRVGVRFFGHRVGWSRSQPVKVLTQTDYTGTIPNELAPGEDVELVLPLGRFGPVEAGRVVRLMPGLKPWGQSPLYLSLTQAMGDFDADRADTDRSIVVITDGGNYQFTPSSTNVRSRPTSTLQQVLSAWKGRNLPVHIVGFGLDEDQPEVAAIESEFQRITKATGGEYVPVQSGQDLMKVLRARLGLGTYRVNDDRGVSVVKPTDPEAPPGIRLNQPVRITGLGAGPRKYRVEFESQAQALVLEGGERIDFDLSPEGRFATRAFTSNVVATLPLMSGRSRLLARIHRPLSDRDGLTFRISLQDENLEFTRRPDEVWVEITPVSENGAAPSTFVFYERNFEPQMPVPVVTCRIPGWPAGANSARVQLWCKFAPSTSVLSRTIEQIDRQAGSEEESVPGVQGIRFRVAVESADTSNGLTELRITEQHSAASPGIDSLRVQLNAPVDLMPQRIERQSDATAGVVVHSLFVPRERWLKLKSDPRAKLVMTTREAAREGAWRAENDLAATVDVSLSGDTLPIQPPKAKLSP